MFHRKLNCIGCLLLVIAMLISICPLFVAAKDSTLEVSGKIYAFDKDAHYVISTDTQSDDDPFGVLCLNGNLRESGTMGAY